VHGGGGQDFFSYSGLEGRPSLDVSLDDTANDGAPGEGDNIHPDIEVLIGIDQVVNTFVGSAGPNEFQGGSLGDNFSGGGGDDYLRGFGGGDDIDGGTGKDRIEGSSGADILRAQDGEADTTVDCSAGSDTAFVDVFDSPLGCEVVNVGP
jgi:Ca2+-binding RTX toxin-like protein